MDGNLSAFSTDTLKNLLESKLQKPQTAIIKQVVEAIRNELESREKKH